MLKDLSTLSHLNVFYWVSNNILLSFFAFIIFICFKPNLFISLLHFFVWGLTHLKLDDRILHIYHQVRSRQNILKKLLQRGNPNKFITKGKEREMRWLKWKLNNLLHNYLRLAYFFLWLSLLKYLLRSWMQNLAW